MRKLVAISVGAFLFAYSSGEARAAEKEAGKIMRVKGKVFILNSKSQIVADPEGKRGRSTKPGSKFFVGETIQTKARSRVKLHFVEGGPKGKNEVVLGPNTTLVIQKVGLAGSKNPGTRLSLSNGKIRANVRRKYSGDKGETFEVSTPNAVAGVRGTIFSAFYNAFNQKTDFATEVGSIVARSRGSAGNPGTAVRVDAGMFTSSGIGTGGLGSAAPLSQNPQLRKAVNSLSDDGGFSRNERPGSVGPGFNAGEGEYEEFIAASGDGEMKSESDKARMMFEAPELMEDESGEFSAGPGSRNPASAGGNEMKKQMSMLFEGTMEDEDFNMIFGGGEGNRDILPPSPEFERINEEIVKDLIERQLDDAAEQSRRTKDDRSIQRNTETVVTITISE